MVKRLMFCLILFFSLSRPLHAIDSLNDYAEAITSGRVDLVQAYVKRHPSWATIELDERHTTPLSLAISRQDADMVEFLLKHGARADSPDIKFRPPIYYAISTGNLEVVKVMLKHGARVNSHDFTGLSPLKYAEQFDNTDIEDLIRQYGGR
jgi:ankyrin repeat protein